MEILSFVAGYIDEAARILAVRHRRDRQTSPALPEAFEQPDNARGALKALLDKGAAGVAAVRRGRLAGYLLGTADFNLLRGRHVWIDYAGSAVAEGERVELYRDLYAAAATEWVKRGFFKHYAVVPSADSAAVDAWFRLGFGHEQVHGVVDLPAVSADILSPEDYEIRLATKADEDLVRSIATTIWEYQTKAPTWAVSPPEEIPELRDGYAELLGDAKVRFWLAVREQEILGYQVFWPNESATEDMMVPRSSISLGVGGTVPQARGKGIGTALVQRGLAEAAAAGFLHCTTDWRMTNLLSSRFWPRRGFRPIAYRLFRQVDPRIAWADGRE